MPPPMVVGAIELIAGGMEDGETDLAVGRPLFPLRKELGAPERPIIDLHFLFPAGAPHPAGIPLQRLREPLLAFGRAGALLRVRAVMQAQDRNAGFSEPFLESREHKC